ncbi:MAG: FAD-binding oxidoreductase [Verrucomicrobia bacterium]|nr:FAD-binding oxidoreductase [Verrucomicrobiota bacterium]
MNLRPANKDEVAGLLAAAHVKRARIGRLDLGAMCRVLEHAPEDMTVTVEAGITLAALQQQLAPRRQWLPIDPPLADRLSISDLISGNISGPRRFGFGTVRDHLLGVQVALADGRLVRSGGKVVKNVAGFDVMKLFIGGEGSLGIIVEATFKLLPLPETEHFVARRCDSVAEARRIIDDVLDSPLTPSVLDLHNVGCEPGDFQVVAGFSGAYEDVDWQLAQASGLGFIESTTLDYERVFWNQPAATVQRHSVLPSRVTEVIGELGGMEFVARAGNGIVYHRGSTSTPAASSIGALARRLKETFDPNGVLPSITGA